MPLWKAGTSATNWSSDPGRPGDIVTRVTRVRMLSRRRGGGGFGRRGICRRSGVAGAEDQGQESGGHEGRSKQGELSGHRGFPVAGRSPEVPSKLLPGFRLRHQPLVEVRGRPGSGPSTPRGDGPPGSVVPSSRRPGSCHRGPVYSHFTNCCAARDHPSAVPQKK